MTTSVILGAGFSKCAGLPTQNEFPNLLLAEELYRTPIQKAISEIINQYLIKVFGWQEHSRFPTLEDYFTCIDLSANTGHNLGMKHTPKMLRAIRRMSIHRIFQILDYKYEHSNVIDNFLRLVLQREKAGFVVTNWDIVLERGLQDQGAEDKINYGFECYKWQTIHRKQNNTDDVLVLKMHGSSNWVYCENCVTIFYDLDKKLALHNMIGLNEADFRLFKKRPKGEFQEALGVTRHSRKCRYCQRNLATHITTFSFRKSYRTFAYSSIWHNAQTLLSQSDEWIFVGYSLPDTDFEFKHMLKTAELTRGKKNLPKILVIVKNDLAAENRFRAFFGKRIEQTYQGGLEEFVSSK